MVEKAENLGLLRLACCWLLVARRCGLPLAACQLLLFGASCCEAVAGCWLLGPGSQLLGFPSALGHPLLTPTAFPQCALGTGTSPAHLHSPFLASTLGIGVSKPPSPTATALQYRERAGGRTGARRGPKNRHRSRKDGKERGKGKTRVEVDAGFADC